MTGQVPRVAAILNGHWLGVRSLNSQWTEVLFDAPGRFWFVGANELRLRFSEPPARSGVAAPGGAPDAAGCPGVDALSVEP
jgi:hypothetical protein